MTLQYKLPRLAAAAVLVGAAACAKTGDRAADTTAPATAMTNDSAMMRRDSAAGVVANDSTMAARGGWSPVSTLSFTTAANSGEIEEARLAEKKAINPAVKAFARQLHTDHEAMLKDGSALAGKLNVTVDTTSGEAHEVMEHVRDELKELTDKPAGADWDAEYIDKQIDGHQKVLEKLQDAAKNTTDTGLRAALEKATGKVQEHLTKAQDIKENKLKK